MSVTVVNGFVPDHPYTGGEGEGEGVFVFSGGDYFEGGWKDNKHAGSGKIKLASGETMYEGGFLAGKAEGKGTYRWASGSTYEGEWKNGNCHGSGTYTFSNGNVYTGEWKEGRRHGWGKHTIAAPPRCSEQYEGEWVDDRRCGRGSLLCADGEAEVSRFQASARVGEGARWAPDRSKAWRLQDGRAVSVIPLDEAAKIAEALGLPVPDVPPALS
mmetsp:Transcript_33603/g.73737  ORF Transcript_33603/g.73737 Transcript_33603/m.73737 type:complete len:214 (-) Transcript_33603:1383-2024(-)|eukprot:6208913-Pleurochrysis_carterae.AAC.3